MNLIKGWIEKVRDRNLIYGSIAREYLPVFHGKYMIKNKDFVELSEDDRRIEKLKLEEQDGVPVKFHKGFEDSFSKGYGKHKGNPEFTAGGITQGDVIRIAGGGYLENGDEIYEAILVTDRFVYMKNLTNDGIIPFSHDEIDMIRNMGGIV